MDQPQHQPPHQPQHQPPPQPDQPLNQPQSPPQQDKEAYDPELYDKFLVHNKYRRSFTVINTELLRCFMNTTRYMQPLHSRPLEKIDEERSRGSREDANGVSRTTHAQIAAIIKRYLAEIAKRDEELLPVVTSAIAQAEQIERRAKERADALQRDTAGGNVKFVKKITQPKRR